MPKYGPGTLQFGETGTEIDVSCQVNSATIEPSKDKADDKTMLCGTVKAGAVTYTYVLTGNLDIDSETADGFFAFCDANAGAEVPFTYTPNTAAETTATGTVVIDPLAFGGEEYGEDMASDFEFDLVGKPTYTYPEPVPPALMAQRAKWTKSGRRVINGALPAGVKPDADGTYATGDTSTEASTTKTATKKETAGSAA